MSSKASFPISLPIPFTWSQFKLLITLPIEDKSFHKSPSATDPDIFSIIDKISTGARAIFDPISAGAISPIAEEPINILAFSLDVPQLLSKKVSSLILS